MSQPQPVADRAPLPAARPRRSVAAFLVGVPAGVAVLYLFQYGPLRHTEACRYVKHKVEWVEVVMFCCAVAALGAKVLRALGERWAGRTPVLPAWDGSALPAGEAAGLLNSVRRLPRALQETRLGRRVTAVLDFVRSRGSADDLDDQLRALADNDMLALEGSYALTRFITWAIPILGFLGTVLGITEAISGVTPEKLESNLSQVTDGLALAFDTTALGLGLTMLTMFLSFLTERAEQGVLDAADRFVERELAHRFERTTDGAAAARVRPDTQLVLQAVEQLVQRQAAVWARSLEEMERRRAEVEGAQVQRLVTALEAALERTQEAHGRRLAALEKQVLDQGGSLVERMASLTAAAVNAAREQHAGLARVAEGVAAQAQGLARLQEGERHLVRLQEALNQNLAALAGAGAFEQAVHSLTAAVHLLTARSAPTAGARPGPRPGAAA